MLPHYELSNNVIYKYILILLYNIGILPKNIFLQQQHIHVGKYPCSLNALIISFRINISPVLPTPAISVTQIFQANVA